MVTSEIKIIKGNEEVVFHYCSICGMPYIHIENAENCERNHNRHYACN